jgi:hypothetical protein
MEKAGNTMWNAMVNANWMRASRSRARELALGDLDGLVEQLVPEGAGKPRRDAMGRLGVDVEEIGLRLGGYDPGIGCRAGAHDDAVGRDVAQPAGVVRCGTGYEPEQGQPLFGRLDAGRLAFGGLRH